MAKDILSAESEESVEPAESEKSPQSGADGSGTTPGPPTASRSNKEPLSHSDESETPMAPDFYAAPRDKPRNKNKRWFKRTKQPPA